MSIAFTRRQILTGVAGISATSLLATTSMATDTGRIIDIQIKNFAFVAPKTALRVGDRIRWTNQDLSPHTATADDNSWDTGELGTGKSAIITLTKTMHGSYFCAFHPQMKGRLNIQQ